MPLYTLYIRATVTDCTLAKSPNSALRVKLSCGSCREASAAFTVICDTDEKVPIPGSRGEAHLLQRCAVCREQGNVTIVRMRCTAIDASALEAAGGAALATLECRGCEPCAWQAGDGWEVAALGEGGATWGGVSFDEEDSFNEFDERANVPVSVEGVSGEWRKD